MERNLSQSCGREGKREGKIPCGRRICREFGPFRHDMRRKGLGFWGLAAKFPKRGSREFFFAPSRERAGNFSHGAGILGEVASHCNLGGAKSKHCFAFAA